MKFIVAAFIAIGMLFGASAQAAPASPLLMQAEQAVTSSGTVEKVCWGGGCGGWGGGCGCNCWRPCYRPCWNPCYRPCGYYGWGCGVRWWPYRSWYGGGWGGGGWGWGGGW